jgi:rhamnosyl/mannosyltransferase
VLALGRLVPYKGYDVLLEAWASMRARRPELAQFKLVIAGSGPEEQGLRAKAAELGLGSSVELAGDVTEQRKQDLLKEACLFACPSKTTAETFGISILEAMSWGLPVVATRLPTGVALLTRDGACGALAEPGDATGLSAALEAMLLDRERRETAGAANLRYVSDQFSERKFVDAYREILG